MYKDDKYVLELNNEQIFMLYDIIRHGNLYQSSYEPLKELVKKIDIICKNLKK